MGWAFLTAALFTFIAFGNTFWEKETIGTLAELSSKSYTPLFRLLVGIWLWRLASAK
jgi:hypothetical protein